MNKNNPLYKYADKLNEYGINLVKKFIHSKQYSDLRSKINNIDKEIEQLNIEYERKFRELHAAKRNIEINEIPKARDKYVRQHIESYKTHLKIQQIGDNSFETYMKVLNNESAT
jgi:uncharacterized protein involved in exopolysaccharide biosynthesis